MVCGGDGGGADTAIFVARGDNNVLDMVGLFGGGAVGIALLLYFMVFFGVYFDGSEVEAGDPKGVV